MESLAEQATKQDLDGEESLGSRGAKELSPRSGPVYLVAALTRSDKPAPSPAEGTDDPVQQLKSPRTGSFGSRPVPPVRLDVTATSPSPRPPRGLDSSFSKVVSGAVTRSPTTSPRVGDEGVAPSPLLARMRRSPRAVSVDSSAEGGVARSPVASPVGSPRNASDGPVHSPIASPAASPCPAHDCLSSSSPAISYISKSSGMSHRVEANAGSAAPSLPPLPRIFTAAELKDLSEIETNDELRAEFIKYAVKKYAAENVDFWVEGM